MSGKKPGPGGPSFLYSLKAVLWSFVGQRRKSDFDQDTGKLSPIHVIVPGPSRWPMLSGISMLVTMVGASAWVNDSAWGKLVCLVGIAAMLAVLYGWFGDAIHESEGGMYSRRIDHSYRWSMAWFIFSEVMFFGAFFGALFWARVFTLPSFGETLMVRLPLSNRICGTPSMVTRCGEL